MEKQQFKNVLSNSFSYDKYLTKFTIDKKYTPKRQVSRQVKRRTSMPQRRVSLMKDLDEFLHDSKKEYPVATYFELIDKIIEIDTPFAHLLTKARDGYINHISFLKRTKQKPSGQLDFQKQQLKTQLDAASNTRASLDNQLRLVQLQNAKINQDLEITKQELQNEKQKFTNLRNTEEKQNSSTWYTLAKENKQLLKTISQLQQLGNKQEIKMKEEERKVEEKAKRKAEEKSKLMSIHDIRVPKLSISKLTN